MPTRLVHGVHRFRTNVFSEQRALYEQLAKGQNPETLFVTCSDSRIVTDHLTGIGPGELFVLRNAGNIVPAHGAEEEGAIATVEYAVLALGVKEIVVCGHTECGAVKGLLDPGSLASMPAVARWLEHASAVRRIVDECHPGLTPEARLRAAVEENVLVQIEHLQTHPAVAARLYQGRLSLHAWVFDIAQGEVSTYDAEEGRFVPLTEPTEVPHTRSAQ